MQEPWTTTLRLDIPITTPLPELIRAEQVKLAYRNLPLALLANVVNGLALVMILWNRLPHLVPLIWFSLVTLLTVARYIITLRYRQDTDLETSSAWEKRFMYGAIGGGILWGSIPIIMFPANAFAYQAMITIILVGMSAGSTVTQSSHRGILQAYLVLLLAPLAIRLALENQPVTLMLSVMVTLFLVMISIAASRLHRNSIEHIRLGLEAKKREQDLKLAKDQYRNLFEMASDGIFILDTEGNFINANRIAYERLGYQREELLGMNIAQLLPRKFAERMRSRIKNIHEHGSFSFESEHVCKDGRIMQVEVNARLTDYRGQNVHLSIVRDITERKQADDRLRSLSRAIDQAGESVIITDRNGLIEYVNPAFTAITGYTSEEAIGSNPRFLGSGRQAAAFYRDMWNTVLSGKVWQKQLIDRHKDGTNITISMSLAPIIDDSGAITHVVGIQRDISEHVELEERLRQAQKMEAIGTLVGGIAHDFNNMLAGITGNIFLAKQKISHLPDVTKRLEQSEKMAYNASKMIQKLLTFARKGMVEITTFDLREFLQETNQLYKTTIPENITYTHLLCERDLPVRGDEIQIQQVIINLLNNARDAVAGVENPRITLRLDAFDAPPGFLRRHNVSHRHFACIRVADNGQGIAPQHLERVFEPFFTTKEVGAGTGLGLAMVYGTIATFGGLIDVESTPGIGTEFRIYLPAQPQQSLKRSADPREEAPVSGCGETLLVVDDDAQVRETTCRVLEGLGYKVHAASDGLEAVEAFSANPDGIMLIIMDLVMPKLSGVDAYKQIFDIDPDTRIVFVSGHDLHHGLEGDIPKGRVTLLQKPYTAVELSQTVQDMLGTQPEPA